METVNVLFVSSVDSVDYKLSKTEILRGFIAEKLTTAAQEIFAVVERTVAGYEEEASGLRQEIDRQRRQLEAVLQPRVSLCRIDHQFPVCEPAAGGAAELPAEEEQHRSEQNVEDSGSPDIIGHTEEDEGGDEEEEEEDSAEEPEQTTSLDQEHLGDSDHQITNTRGQSVEKKRRRRSHINLRVCMLRDSQATVLKKCEMKSVVKILRFPGGLQESDFLNRLKSTFPQLRGQFDAFTTDATRTLTPLKLKTLTPREIQRSIKSRGKGRSALYIRAQPAAGRAAELPAEDEQKTQNVENSRSREVLGQDGEEEGEDEEDESAEETVETASPDQEDPDHQITNTRGQSVERLRRRRSHINLRVCLLRDSQTTVLTKGAMKSAMKILRCPRGLQEPDFLKLLKSTFLQLKGQFDAFTADASRTLTPLKLKTLTPREIQRSIKSRGKGRSALYIRAQPAAGGAAELPAEDEQQKQNPEDPHIICHTEGEEGEDEEDESADETVETGSLDEEDPDPQITNTRGQSEERKRRRRSHINLRVCLLRDSQTTVLTKGAMKSVVKILRCPRGLQESDFLNRLKSTFPRVTGRFDAFTTDATRTLTPLKLKTLTPREIQRSIKSRGKGRSALYIREQKAKNSLKSNEQLPPPQGKDSIDTGNDENRPHASPVENVENNEADHLSISSVQEEAETQKDSEQLGTSDDVRAVSSAHEGDNGDDDDDDDELVEDDRDEDWKPDKNDKEPRDTETELNSKMTKKRRLEHSRVKTKNRKKVQSSLKASTDKSDAPLPCKVCRALHNSMKILIKHAWNHVDDPERLCGVCGEHPESVEELRSHLQSHQKTHRCNICGKSFLTVVGLNRHAAVHTGERPYKCDVCHKAYTNNFTLKTHRWMHVEDKPHKCDVCNQSFAFTQQLRVHSRTHTGEKPYTCDVCGKSVGDLRSLSRHKLAHTGEKRYSCQVCGKRFLTPGVVKAHEKIHTERERKYLCDICCKTFPTGCQLKAHLKRHSAEKIICSECGKGLSSQGALTRHMLIHTGERPYKCSECGRTFNSLSTLRGHLTTHSGVKRFVCGVCGKACARQEHLKVHMRTHNGEKPYQCTFCDKAFTQSHCLKTHMKSHQREEQSAVDGLKD